MKVVIRKQTGLDEEMLFELEQLSDIPSALIHADKRLAQTNQKVVEVREFISQVKDPNYRYLFTAFLDQFLGISSNAESLLRKFKVEPPEGFDAWMRKKDAK